MLQKILCINNSFSEMDHLAAVLSKNGLLSQYVRPYVNKDRLWERTIMHLPGLGDIYHRTVGRRRLLEGLTAPDVRETAVVLDLAMALTSRLPGNLTPTRQLAEALMHARARAIARAGARYLRDERVVVACWGSAEPAFRRMKTLGGLCVLDYPSAHYRFTRKYLLEEAQREPNFSGTLNTHNYPQWLEEQFEQEISLADRILVGSSFVKESFLAEAVPEEKLTVVPYGVDTRLFEPSMDWEKPGDDFRILFVGQIGQRKGISYLLRAYERFQGANTVLTLVGALQGDGKAFAPYSGLFNHIPHLPRIALRGVYQQADVFLFPTLVEGMGLVVLEAMASGLPVITTPNGPGDIVRDGVDGYLVPPRDVDAIVERLEFLRSHPEARIEMARNARQRALEFTWQTYENAAVSALKSLVH